jgi:hypothetical protein
MLFASAGATALQRLLDALADPGSSRRLRRWPPRPLLRAGAPGTWPRPRQGAGTAWPQPSAARPWTCPARAYLPA